VALTTTGANDNNIAGADPQVDDTGTMVTAHRPPGGLTQNGQDLGSSGVYTKSGSTWSLGLSVGFGTTTTSRRMSPTIDSAGRLCVSTWSALASDDTNNRSDIYWVSRNTSGSQVNSRITATYYGGQLSIDGTNRDDGDWPRMAYDGFFVAFQAQNFDVARAVYNGVFSTTQVYVTQTPLAWAGPDLTAVVGVDLRLAGSVRGTASAAWSQVSGPGTAAFGAPTQAKSTVRFPLAGTYVLRLTSGGSSDDVTITVTDPQPALPAGTGFLPPVEAPNHQASLEPVSARTESQP
jgi:hypothetical protein